MDGTNLMDRTNSWIEYGETRRETKIVEERGKEEDTKKKGFPALV